MDDTQSVATLIDSTTSKIQQLQQAFAELEGHRAVSLNLKWKELEEHFHGLERSLKKRFVELEDEEKEYETKASEAREMLEKREAVVVAKEQASLGQLQEKRDAALSAIGDAFEKYKKALAETVVNGVSNGNTDVTVEEKSDITTAEVNTADAQPAKNGGLDVKPRPQLTKLCEEMDAAGLHKFISDNRKNLAAIREEIPFALKSAPEPARLVLDGLEDFYRVELPLPDGKKDSSLLGLRRTCLMLMESLGVLLTSSESESPVDNPLISLDIREQAKTIANGWKPKLDNLDNDASTGNSLEAHAFLQLLATFGIASEFDQDEICKLIPTVSRRRQTADLCRSLGLSEKMPGAIEVLVNNGRQMEAVNLAYAFELTDQFATVPLLKAYLKDARRTSQVQPGNTSPAAQNEANERELSALKAVIKCIEEHKLEDQYPVDPLQKRVIQLEKAKADKKRAAEAAKPQPKRPRANGNGYGPRITNLPDKSFYRGPPERYPYMYDRPYIYAPDNHGLAPVGLPPYNLSPNHAPYYGNGYQYPTPYLQ
ncbi:FRIGIDA-like protein 3 [Magnolia sinica]|uniref:FRIGIDA-like protein 3 n=1 Tax=Magnolia sinica TaxID=86752 RepID=UPI002659F920|nr:FRIGIDA-like protein 3 [Magnolia sinica]